MEGGGGEKRRRGGGEEENRGWASTLEDRVAWDIPGLDWRGQTVTTWALI